MLPPPWGFFTSGYILGLVAMAILVHRIQHIVVPPRHPHTRPIDFSASLVRLCLRLPSLYLLFKSLLLWSTILAQSAHYPLARWVARYDTPALCWYTFCAVCAALSLDALTRGLDGSSSSPSPFNLFGYAFLLHIYSSPLTHATQRHGLPPRPDIHAVFTIILPLFQLTVVHCLGIKQSWSHHRLIPSAFVSILALVHFHWVLWFSDATFPLLNFMPCAFESLLLFLTCLAIFLNALTQILAEGALSRPLFGHHAALLPRLDEDFSIALLRIGTASLETSSLAGFGNQVGSVALMPPPIEVTSVSLSRFGVDAISHCYRKNNSLERGFTNEIKHVKATSRDGDLWLDLAWYREFVAFAIDVVRFLKRLYSLSRDFLKSPRLSPPLSPSTEDSADDQLHPDVYDRFIHGEQLSDDEDDEYEPASPSSSIESFSSISDDSPYDNHAETVGLYADLSSTITSSTSASHLLAHLADQSSSPLTRRRFTRLVSGSSDPPHPDNDGWTDVIHARRPAIPRSEEAVDDARRNCVICTVEPRQVICWPCRCLALCDDCRENLASRSSVSKHMCPCCRTSVQGYSKIYIP